MRFLKELELFEDPSTDLRVFDGRVVSISETEIVVKLKQTFTKGWKVYSADPAIFKAKGIKLAGDKFMYSVRQTSEKTDITLRRENDVDISARRSIKRNTPRFERIG